MPRKSTKARKSKPENGDTFINTGENVGKISILKPIISGFLYTLSISFTIPVMPKIINRIVNGNDDIKVTPASSSYYGFITGTDQLFTFLTVSTACALSDRLGRKPFMILSALGLGTGQFLASHAKKVIWPLFVGAMIDGMTSFSSPIATSYISDITPSHKLGEAFGLFQGIAQGAAFMVGIPIAGILGKKFGIMLPLKIAYSLCLI